MSRILSSRLLFLQSSLRYSLPFSSFSTNLFFSPLSLRPIPLSSSSSSSFSSLSFISARTISTISTISTGQPVRIGIRIPPVSTFQSRLFSTKKKEASELATKVGGKLKQLWKSYGIIAVATYFGTYILVLGIIYALIELGIVSKTTPLLRHLSTKLKKKNENEDGNHKKKESMSMSGSVKEQQEQIDRIETTIEKSENPNHKRFNVLEETNKFVDLAEKFGIANIMDVHKVDAKTKNFVIAWVATKFTEPVRLALTIFLTPRIARFLGRVPPKPKRR